APSIINAVRLLSEYGYQVDIITRRNRNEYGPPPNFQQDIRILECRRLSIRILEWLIHYVRAQWRTLDLKLKGVQQDHVGKFNLLGTTKITRGKLGRVVLGMSQRLGWRV